MTSIAVNNNEVYVGGHFVTAGGALANHVAKWDGTTWSALGGGVAGGINGTGPNAFAFAGRDVYVGGNFDTADGIPVHNIARWDGTNWFPLGSGVGGEVKAMALNGNDLYLCGSFTTAGGNVSARFARWSIPVPAPFINSVTFNGNKTMIISGTNLAATRVLINGQDSAGFIRAASDSTIKIKGKRAALGLVSGSNTVQVIVPGGPSSNIFTLVL